MSDQGQEFDGKHVDKRASISLYEFYVLGIDKLLVKTPWELGRAVSAYHEVFLVEQRCVGLTILLLLGEDHVPASAIETMPGFEEQVRDSVNQAIFKRALKHYFERAKLDTSQAEQVLTRMIPYLADARTPVTDKETPLHRMLETMSKRVPPKDDRQRELYIERIDKIYDYTESLVKNNLLKRFAIIS